MTSEGKVHEAYALARERNEVALSGVDSPARRRPPVAELVVEPLDEQGAQAAAATLGAKASFAAVAAVELLNARDGHGKGLVFAWQ
mgnify:CR=1 FL=1